MAGKPPTTIQTVKNYIPAKDADAAAWATNFGAVATADPLALGLTAPNAVTITAAALAFSTALATATDPGTRTSATIAAKNEARAAMELTCRPFAVQVSLDSNVTDEAKTAAGVTVRKTVPTPVPAPSIAPTLAIVSAIPGQATLSARQPGSAGKAKPAGAVGVEIVSVAGTVAAVSPEQASAKMIATKTPFAFSVAPSEVGKVITVFGRYITRSGPGGVAQSGPWSAPLVFSGI